MNEGKRTQRLRVLATIVVLMFVAMVTRLWFLQVLAAERYRGEASANSIREIEQPAPRGKILDRNGKILVENKNILEITVNRQQSPEDRATVVQNLSELLDIPPETLTTRIEDPRYYPYAPVPVAFDVDKRLTYAIHEYPEDFPGVDYGKVAAREYPEGERATHILGHIGVLVASDANDPLYADYAPDESTGRDGVEKSYETDLRGQKGIIRRRVNAQGKVIPGDLPGVAGVPGNDLVLTIDEEIQRKAETMLANGIDRVKGTSGAAIVLDAKTGGVVAMASYPSYEPTVWDNGINANERKKLGLPRTCFDETGAVVVCNPDAPEPKNPPLLNVATQGEFAPGSTFKPFVALAALKEGMATENEQIPCPAQWSPPTDQNFIVTNWDPVDQGKMNLQRALIVSCDTVFYELGQRFYNKYHKNWEASGDEIVGVPLFQRALEEFGFGDYTNLDLPAGSPGLIPDQVWKQTTYGPHVPNNSRHRCDYNWCPGDSVQMAIGQKDVRVTPMQLASGFQTIATDGVHCQPHLGLRIQSPTGKTVREIKPVCDQIGGFTQGEFDFVKTALRGVVRDPSGTADAAFSGFPFNQVDVMGKTGTAQVQSQHGADNAWFAAITKGEDANKQEQEYVVVVLVERGGHGGTTSAPIARQIIEAAYGLGESNFRLGEVSD